MLQADQLVVLESTTYPGTTRERVVPILEESGLAAGRDFHVAFSPERVDPGRTDFTLRNTPKVVGDIRESPALKILTLLSALGADVRYHDPSRSRAQVDIASRRYRGAPTGNQARYAHHAPRRGRTPRPHERRSPPARADATQKHTPPLTTHSRSRQHAISKRSWLS